MSTRHRHLPAPRLRPLAAALLLAGCSAVSAQTLAPVTVIATPGEAAPFDVPASVDVIDGARLRAAGRTEMQLSESLAIVPGVMARDRQNWAQDLQLSIRGFGARSSFGVRGVRLYVDGIPSTMPDGQGQLSHFDLSSASRVEVLRGPFSALYGNSAGGVLQLFTERGEGPPVVTGTVAVGSDGLVRPSVRAVGAAGAVGFNVSASHFETDGWRDHSGAERDLGNLRLDWTAAGGDWMLVTNVVRLGADDPLGLSRAQFDSAPRSVDPSALTFNTRKTVRQSQVGLVHERTLAPGHKLRFLGYTGDRETVQFQAIPVATQANVRHPGGVIDLERSYAGADVRWTWQAAPYEVVAGLSYDGLKEQRRGWENFVGPVLGVQGRLRRDEENHVRNLDPYVQALWKVTPDWTVAAGVRRSDVRFESRDRYVTGANGDDSGSLRYSAWLPSAGVTYNLAPTLHLYAAAGKGFETPTFNELAYRPDGTPGLNSKLQPSRSRNLEAGIKGRSAPGAVLRSEWTVAVFQSDTEDEIVTQTNQFGRSTFQNAGATRRRGLELGWGAALGPGWKFQAAHTWLDARYREAFATCAGTPCATPTLVIPAGNRMPGTVRAFSAAEVAWEPAQGWRAGVEWRRSGRLPVNDANTDAAQGWNTFAGHVGYLWVVQGWKTEATARVDNLLNRTYAGSVIVNEGNQRFFETAPGRQFSLKVAVTRAF